MNKTKDFHLKQFSIQGGQAGMAVSTDGILLGAWAAISDHSQILDIGTGTGLLALMSAQRTQNSHITAIDIDDAAIIAASLNCQKSPWPSRIQVKQSSLQGFEPNTQYDHIVCNPPYFNSGETSQWQARATARHTQTLSHQDLLSSCGRLLKPTGNASFILPKAEGDLFIQKAQQAGWQVSRLCQVNTTQQKPSYRLLFTLVKYSTETRHSTLTIHQDGGYSPEFIALTQDFYLKM